MENEKYLSEEKYQKNNDKVKRIGKILLILGILTTVIGLVMVVLSFSGVGDSFLNSIQSAESGNIDNAKIAKDVFGGVGFAVIAMIINSIGFTITVISLICLFIGYRREITAYTTQQVIPVAQEGVEKMTPTIAGAAKEITKGIKEGLKDE